jgi:hypothetical protein
MKTLKQIQEENRKFIIMANNPTAKTYDEALEMELLNEIPCLVKVKYNGNQNEFDRLIFYTLQNEDGQELVEMGGERMPRKIVSRIIGGLLTLNRVLIAFESMGLGYLDESLFVIDNNVDVRYNDEKKIICDWNPKKETLEEQSEETQRKINELKTK